jgi:hypothetical protein
MKLVAPLSRMEKEVHQNIQSLVKSLRNRLKKNIAVLLPADRKDLRTFFPSSTCSGCSLDPPGFRSQQETMAIAHQLRPRFIDSLQGDYASTIEVLRKIAKGQRENR